MNESCKGCHHLTDEGCGWAYDEDDLPPNPPDCYNLDEGEMQAVIVYYEQ